MTIKELYKWCKKYKKKNNFINVYYTDKDGSHKIKSVTFEMLSFGGGHMYIHCDD